VTPLPFSTQFLFLHFPLLIRRVPALLDDPFGEIALAIDPGECEATDALAKGWRESFVLPDSHAIEARDSEPGKNPS
jgi:hypothetical protein